MNVTFSDKPCIALENRQLVLVWIEDPLTAGFLLFHPGHVLSKRLALPSCPHGSLVISTGRGIYISPVYNLSSCSFFSFCFLSPKPKMSPAVLVTARWPPAPSVEDESESLAREVTGWSEKRTAHHSDGLVPSRGSIDQYPILIAVDGSVESQAYTEYDISRPHSPQAYAGTRTETSRVRFVDSHRECTRMHPHGMGPLHASSFQDFLRRLLTLRKRHTQT